MKYPYHFFTCDPGWNTALAWWKSIEATPDTYLLKSKHYDEIEVRLSVMWEEFEYLLNQFSCKLLVLESTEYWEQSLKSKTSHRRGDVHTLTLLIGGYCDIARKQQIPFILKPARKWKGNMTDPQVRRRVRYITGIDYSNPHICDAVGMGLSLQGKFNVRKRKIK